MKKNIINKLTVFISFCLLAINVNSQQVNTLYFMDNTPYRNTLNPAFQPLSGFYLGFPILGYSQFNLGNNSLTLKDFAYNDVNGNPILFLHPDGNVDKFYNALNTVTSFNTEVQLNLLTFGFRTGKSYWNLSITERLNAEVGLPKDFMKLLLYGTPDPINNIYDFKNLGVDMSLYTEVGLGYSREINDKWNVGGKLKFLAGSANVQTAINKLELQAGIDQWTIKGDGSMNVSVPGNLQIGDNFQTFNYEEPTQPFDFLNGMGAGVDLGVTFKPINALTISAAVTDLGFIHWNKNVQNVSFTTDYTFTGVGTIDPTANIDPQIIGDSIIDALIKSTTTPDPTTKAYTSYTSPKLNIGIEYGFFDNKLTLGVLSRTIKHNDVYDEELTGSINVKPANWFNLSASYSVFNGRMSNIGAGIGLRTGFVHWFMSADYVPLRFASYDLPSGSPIPTAYIPYNTKGVNVAFGTSIVFGNRQDKDRDGITNRKDICPDTPRGVVVDKKGCPVDTDGDEIPDYLDKCPNSPLAAKGFVDSKGCPIDTDGDGVYDFKDKCSNTPVEARGSIDENGCPKDTDNDGIFDYLDKCPGTPAGVQVDSNGCPLDSDGDGVADYLDLCPNTPLAAKGLVDKNGCPLDSDDDGVYDYLDLCANTPIEARGFIDKNGCPLDSDDDGVADYLDKCPNTPVEARGTVDEKGCPRDTDGDGIADYLDNCPKLFGVAANKGCPEVKKEIRTLFQKALQGIQFESGKDVIKKSSNVILDQIAKVLVDNKSYLVEIQGHTDNVGKPELNQLLSEKRANAVRNYLIAKGVEDKRITAKGYGDTKPVASNKTTQGKAKNRRVEFIVTFEEVTFE